MQTKETKEILLKFQKFIHWEAKNFGISKFFQELIKIFNK
jgi:hypothetical protein